MGISLRRVVQVIRIWDFIEDWLLAIWQALVPPNAEDEKPGDEAT